MATLPGKDPFPADFQVSLFDVNTLGEGLRRPECVLATASGMFYVADSGGGVACLTPGNIAARADASRPLTRALVLGGGIRHTALPPIGWGD